MRKMDKKIFEKKMRNKYRITAVSLLVVILFFGTAMTSAIAGSVDKSQSSSTSGATGCTLCASQRKGNGGKSPLFGCDELASYIAETLFTIAKNYIKQKMQDPDFQSAVAKLMKAGWTLLDATAIVVKKIIKWAIDNKEGIRTYVIDPLVDAIKVLGKVIRDPDAWALAILILTSPAVISLVVMGFNFGSKLVNFAGKAYDAFSSLVTKIHQKCIEWGLCSENSDGSQLQPQAPGSTGYTEPISVPSTSQSVAQSIMQTAAPSIQQSSVSSVSSSQISSVISQITVAPSTQQSSVSSLLISPSVISQISQTTVASPSIQQSSISSQSSLSSSQSSSVISQPIVAPSKQQSTAAPVMIGVASILRGQQATND
jgi:hypothetical protein